MESPDTVLTVTQLTREIREVLEGHIGSVWVEGEISNHRLQSSGHQYFTLKDSGSQVSCVMFRGSATRSGVRLTDGAQVQIYGEISVYEPRGQYQMVVKQVQLKGQGSLQARFETLKKKLYDEGLFDQDYKQPIPKFPRIVALVTSPTGAAIQDMLNILTRRAPWVRLLVFPVRVQGQGVERETIRALEVLNAAEQFGLPRPDTIVIGRGGGSIEDLWAYNEESLARAIFTSRIPIISAVGHEIDFTIADFVADLRAPTPSAAAELLAPDVAELRRYLESTARILETRVQTVIEHHERVLDLTAKGPLLHEPERQIQQAEQSVDDAESRLTHSLREQLRAMSDQIIEQQQILQQHHPRVLISEAGHRVQIGADRLRHVLEHRLVRLEDRVKARADLMRNLGPQSILSRGFSFTMTADGRSLQDATQVQAGDVLVTRLQRGEVRSVVSD
jgi:exodeoxyribonuclease VII large subunit